jgi:hypothetical protein
MKALAILAVLLLAPLLPACALNEQDKAAREWQRNECNRVIDREDREKCLKRAD